LYEGTDQIIDPTAADWTGYNLIWLYRDAPHLGNEDETKA
jgi:hypothetical protein